jgi:hypothetical protein
MEHLNRGRRVGLALSGFARHKAPPADAALRENFRKHQTPFARLRDQILEDRALDSVRTDAYTWIDPCDPQPECGAADGHRPR